MAALNLLVRGVGIRYRSHSTDERKGMRRTMEADRYREIAEAALQLLVTRCPRLASTCYWAGTASIALEELHHRQSFDLDFHTRKALYNVRPILAEVLAAFPGAFEVVRAPDEFGSGFQGVLTLPDGERTTVEVLSNYEDVPDRDLVKATTVTAVKRVSLSRYLADKVQCLVERAEAKDLVDIMAVLQHRPDMEKDARRRLAEQDAVLLVERLLAWTDEAIREDLAAYDDVAPEVAVAARDLLLHWVKTAAAEGGDT